MIPTRSSVSVLLMRLWTVGLLVGWCLLGFHSTARAQFGIGPLEDPFYSYTLQAVTPQIITIDRNGTSNLGLEPNQISHTVAQPDPSNSSINRDGTATILVSQGDNVGLRDTTPLTLFTTGPWIYASASTSNGHNAAPNLRPAVSADGVMGFEFRPAAIPLMAPPFTPTEVPLLALVALEVAVEGPFDHPSVFALAEFDVTRNGSPIARRSVGSFSFTPNRLVELVPLTFQAGSDYKVFLSAEANLFDAKTQGVEVHALADPVIMFDQATFDATWGEQSFQLDQFFEIEYSPGIMIPEPATAALFLLGILAIATAARQRSPRIRS